MFNSRFAKHSKLSARRIMFGLSVLFSLCTVACGGGGGGGNTVSAVSNEPSVSTTAFSIPEQTPAAIALANNIAAPTAAAIALASSSASAAYAVISNFIATAYATITFTPNTRLIGPVSVAAAPATTVSLVNQRNWSDVSLWGGTLPAANATVVIPSNTTVILDTTTPSLGDITVNGTLKFANQNVSLTAKSIAIGSTGALQIGAPGAPFAYKATITLTGAKGSAGNTRGITVSGGKLELYGALPSPVWTQLNDHANAGTRSFTLKESVNWKAGDTIVVGPSDYYGVNPTERLTLAATVVGNTLPTVEPLASFRWGKMQYMTDAGLSLTPGAYTPPSNPAPTQLDERAAVGNLTRNIVIQGANDADWTGSGFGAHVMIMDLASKVFVDGVEFRRVGQAGIMGRYPFHWHLLSYNVGTGAYLGDATGQELRNSTIWQSAQRCVVVHGTNGVKVLNNICQDIKGHAFFLEDAVERRNAFEGNLALMIRSPNPADRLLAHEDDLLNVGSSGFWISNPDNVVKNNVVGDAIGSAYWNSFPTTGVGLSRSVINPDLAGTAWAALQMAPRNMPHGVFDNNVGYSTKKTGINSESMLSGGGAVGGAASNDLGQTQAAAYFPTLNGRPYDINGMYNPLDANDTCAGAPTRCRSTNLRATFSRSTIYKTNDGYYNRIGAPDYPEWVMSDITGTYARGAGSDGAFVRGLFIGQSLNNLTPYPTTAVPQAMFATYHSTFQMRDSTMAHIGYKEDADPERTSSGVFKSDDYYINMLQRETVLNANNKLINAFAGARHYPANLYSRGPLQPGLVENFTLAGALWDPHGYWGNKGFYWVYDVPFLTAGGACQPSLFPTPSGKNSAGKYNGQSCAGEYFGVTHSNRTDFLAPVNSANQSNSLIWPVDIERLDCNPSSYTSTSIGQASRACRWVVGSGYDSWKLGNFRGASLRNGGRYKVMFPTPEDRPGTGNYGRPVFLPGTTIGTMRNAEGQTVPISIPKTLGLQFTNVSRSSDSFVMAVSFDGSKTPTAVIARNADAYNYHWLLGPNPMPGNIVPSDLQYARVLSMTNSLAEVENDDAGTKMWQDRANNLVWFKVVGNLPVKQEWRRIENFTAPAGQDLYQPLSIYMRDNTILN
jgi:hypothetical protein